MFDWSQLRELMWDARWDAVVMFSNAVVTNVGIHWWFGPLFVLLGVTACRRVWLKGLRFVFVTFARSHGGD